MNESERKKSDIELYQKLTKILGYEKPKKPKCDHVFNGDYPYEYCWKCNKKRLNKDKKYIKEFYR